MDRCDISYNCELCERYGECSDEVRREHNKEIIRKRQDMIQYKILVMSNKGGVGKSTVTTNLSVLLAKNGREVGVADADIHGPNIPKMLGVEGKRLKLKENGIEPCKIYGMKMASIFFLLENSDEPVVWRDVWKYDFISQLFGSVNWGNLDYLVVDLPPGTGNESITSVELLGKIDGVIIVTTPQEVALMDSRRSIAFSKINNLPIIGVVENMSGMICPHCSNTIEIFKTGGGEKTANEMGVPFLGRIPFDPGIADRCDRGVPFVLDCPESPASIVFKDIAEKCERYVGNLKEEALEVSKQTEIIREL